MFNLPITKVIVTAFQNDSYVYTPTIQTSLGPREIPNFERGDRVKITLTFTPTKYSDIGDTAYLRPESSTSIFQFNEAYGNGKLTYGLSIAFESRLLNTTFTFGGRDPQFVGIVATQWGLSAGSIFTVIGNGEFIAGGQNTFISLNIRFITSLSSLTSFNQNIDINDRSRFIGFDFGIPSISGSNDFFRYLQIENVSIQTGADLSKQLFTDANNNVDLNKVDIADFSGPFVSAKGGNDVVILPKDGGGLSKWGLVGGFSGGDGDDVITAGSAAALIRGDAGNDTLTGSTADDILEGGDGNDVIKHAAGPADDNANDVLMGGAGADIFEIGHNDRIMDIEIGEPILSGKPDNFLGYNIKSSVNFGQYYYQINLYGEQNGLDQPVKTIYVESKTNLSFLVSDEGGNLRFVAATFRLPPLTLPPIPGPTESSERIGQLARAFVEQIAKVEDMGKAIERYGKTLLDLPTAEKMMFLGKLSIFGKILSNGADIAGALAAIEKVPPAEQAREFIAQSIFLGVKTAVESASITVGASVGALVGGQFAVVGAIPGSLIGTVIGIASASAAASKLNKELIINEARGLFDEIINVIGRVFDDVIDSPGSDGEFMGTDGIDILLGSPGSDIFRSSPDTNIYQGNGGQNDRVDYSAAPAAVTVDLASGFGGYLARIGAPIRPLAMAQSLKTLPAVVVTANIAGASDFFVDIDDVTGSSFDDLLTGDANANRLTGGAGNDRLDGGSGADAMTGGTGDDSYFIDDPGDLVFENAGEGNDVVTSSVSHYLFANVEQLVLSGSADNFGVGNDLANIITGNAGSNLLIGGGGDDTIAGGGGIDALFGEAGNDSLNGGTGIDYLVGGVGNDTLNGDGDADALYGEDGNDLLIGGGDFQTDILVGGAGNDTLDGASGLGDYDLMDGGAGDDTYLVDTPDDLTFEAINGGTDTVRANINGAGYYLYANTENLILEGNTPFGVGNELANRLTGNAIGNYLLGGAGNDILNGKGGNDVLFGEGGADTFVFERGTGGDVIGDFQTGIDKIQLTGLGFSSFAQLKTAFVENAGTTAINLGNGDFIIINGVANAQLGAADFVLG
jgi:Ca2+-binding RTX toxin-like protein